MSPRILENPSGSATTSRSEFRSTVKQLSPARPVSSFQAQGSSAREFGGTGNRGKVIGVGDDGAENRRMITPIALELLRQAIDLDPAMPIALHWLGVCLEILGENQKGLEALRRAMELGFTPSTAAAARLLAQIGRHDEARRLLEGLKSGSTERYEPFFPRSLA